MVSPGAILIFKVHLASPMDMSEYSPRLFQRVTSMQAAVLLDFLLAMHCVQAAVSVDFLLAMHLCGFFTHMHGSFSRAYEGGFFTLPESALPESYLLFLTISQRFINLYNLPENYYSLQSPRECGN